MSNLFTKIMERALNSKIFLMYAKHLNRNRLTQNELKEIFENGARINRENK